MQGWSSLEILGHEHTDLGSRGVQSSAMGEIATKAESEGPGKSQPVEFLQGMESVLQIKERLERHSRNIPEHREMLRVDRVAIRVNRTDKNKMEGPSGSS